MQKSRNGLRCYLHRLQGCLWGALFLSYFAKNHQMKRIRLTNERLNAYGTWVVTAGIDAAQYRRNPVLLYMHRRGEVIGKVTDIKVEGDDITGALEFDEATDLSRTCKKQYEFGSLNMVSVGLTVLELSEDRALLKPGQTRATVTKSKLTEVSLVDIGANDDAVVLSMEDGRTISLAAGSDNPIPLITIKKEMEIKELALQLGMPETSTEAEVTARIAQLSKDSKDNENLRQQIDQMKLSAITAAVETAVNERRITADRKAHFIELGKKVGLDDLNATLSAIAPAPKASQFVSPQSGGTDYKKLSDVPADKVLALRENDKETYMRLYKAEYGIECNLN